MVDAAARRGHDDPQRRSRSRKRRSGLARSSTRRRNAPTGRTVTLSALSANLDAEPCPDGGRRAQPGVRSGRSRARSHPAGDSRRAGARPTPTPWPSANIMRADVRCVASLRDDRRSATRTAIKALQPRRPDRLPAALAAARTRRSCSSFPTVRWPKCRPRSSAPSATGRLRPSPAGQKAFGAIPARAGGAAHRPHQPPGSPQSVIFGGEMHAARSAARPHRRAWPAATCLAAAPSRGSTRICARPRAGPIRPTASTVLRAECGAVPDPGVGPGRPDRQFDGRADEPSPTICSARRRSRRMSWGCRWQARRASCPGQFQTSDAVLGGMMTNALYGRPDNYYETVADKYRRADHRRRSTRRWRRCSTRTRWCSWSSATPATVRPQLGEARHAGRGSASEVRRG